MAMFAIGVAAATAQVATMNLSGSVPAELNGKKMYIINLDTRERIDSAVVKNGKLVFATEVGAGEAVPAAIAEGSKRRLSFILEPGTATINDRGQVKGTRLNNIVEGVGDMLDSLTVDYKARQKQIMQSQMSNDEKMKAAETLYNDVAQKSGDILVETYKANKTNAAGYMMFLQIADGMTVAEMDELLDGAVQWIKGGVAFAPKPRDFSKKINKKMKSAAFRSAISYKVRNNELLVLDKVALEAAKTKYVAKILSNFNFDRKTLLVVGEKDDAVLLAGRNIERLTISTADLVNVYELVANTNVLATESAMRKIEEAYAE